MRRKAGWIGHILRRKCDLKHVIEWQTEEKKWREDEEDVISYWVKKDRRKKWREDEEGDVISYWVKETETEEVTRRRRRRNQLLGDFKEQRYRNFKQEALDRTLWRTLFKEATNLSKTYCGMNEFTRTKLKNKVAERKRNWHKRYTNAPTSISSISYVLKAGG
jgi:hypothetical protein